MKFIILTCLLIYLHCSNLVYLDRYGRITGLSQGQTGVIALSLTKFNRGDTIYLTFIYFEGYVVNSINYCFSNSFSQCISPTKIAYYYSYGSGSVRYYKNYYYDEYYYKIKIPTNEAKANYLLIGYQVSR